MSYFRWSLIVVSAACVLMAAGCAKEAEDKVLWVFNRTVYPEVTHEPEQQLSERLHAAIFSDACDLDTPTVVLIALAHHAGLLRNVFARRDLKQRKQRLQQITSGNAVGQATREAIEAMQAAVMVACIMPVMVSTISGSSRGRLPSSLTASFSVVISASAFVSLAQFTSRFTSPAKDA